MMMIQHYHQMIKNYVSTDREYFKMPADITNSLFNERFCKLARKWYQHGFYCQPSLKIINIESDGPNTIIGRITQRFSQKMIEEGTLCLNLYIQLLKPFNHVG